LSENYGLLGAIGECGREGPCNWGQKKRLARKEKGWYLFNIGNQTCRALLLQIGESKGGMHVRGKLARKKNQGGCNNSGTELLIHSGSGWAGNRESDRRGCQIGDVSKTPGRFESLTRSGTCIGYNFLRTL